MMAAPTCAGCRYWRPFPTDGEYAVHRREYAAGLGFVYPRQRGTDPACQDFTPAPAAEE
jgi:hypothetical protein